MTDRPILFSGPMIRALLAGTKTQTRRVVKPQPFESGYIEGDIDMYEIKADSRGPKAFRFNASAVGGGAVLEEVFEPRISEGDRLYVREAWHAARSLDSTPPREIPHDADIEHAATARSYAEIGLKGKLRPGIHMPRWASRLTLTVSDVRVERLQNINRDDAIAEGVVEDDGDTPDIFYLPGSSALSGVNAPKGKLPIGQHSDPRLVYRDLINNNGGDLWSENPFVVAYTFTVHHRNIDQMAKEAA